MNAMEKLKKYYQFTYAIVYNVSTGVLIFFFIFMLIGFFYF